MMDSFLLSLQNISMVAAIREGDNLFPWIECVHVLALTLVIGSIAMVDLRLLGLRSLDQGVTEMMADMLPITWSAFSVAAISGGLMFASNAIVYVHNVFFLAKMALLVAAGLNMLSYHLLFGRDASSWGVGVSTPVTARLVGAASLFLWIAVAACGRWIGFTINAPT